MEAAVASENLAGALVKKIVLGGTIGVSQWEEARQLLQNALDIHRAQSGPRPDSPAVGRTLRRCDQ
jgi:hypothetical protein